MKQLGNEKPQGGAEKKQAQPTSFVADDFDFFAFAERQGETESVLNRVTDKYNEILKRRYATDPVTVIQYAAVELSSREAVIRQLNIPEAMETANDLSLKISALLDMYKSMPVDPRFQCEPSVQAFRRQIRLEGGMARLVTAYQSDLKAAYMSANRSVYVALPFGGTLPKHINPSKNKENMYWTNMIDGQFGVTGLGLLDYILRAACNGSMFTSGNMSFFPESPVTEFRVNRTAGLVKPVIICQVLALECDPEVDVQVDWSKNGKLDRVRFLPFGGEWTRKTRGLPESMKLLPVIAANIVTQIPSEYFMKKAVRCNGPEGVLDLSALCRMSLDPNWQIKNKIK